MRGNRGARRDGLRWDQLAQHEVEAFEADMATLGWRHPDVMPRVSEEIPGILSAVRGLHDAGFVWGATVTDLCRTFRHRLFRLSDHLDRFRDSCRRARVSLDANDEQLTAIAEQLVAHQTPVCSPP